MSRTSFLLSLFLLPLTACMAQEKAVFTPEILTWPGYRATSPIVIDGKLDDAAWKNAFEINNLYEIRKPDLGPLKVGPDKLQVKVLYDDHYLYVGAHIAERDLVANPESPKRANLSSLFLDGDVFEIFIQPDPKQSVYY